MKVLLNKRPPNYDEISKHLDIKSEPHMVFTYGDDIYIPFKTAKTPPEHLIAHEYVHSLQQKKVGPDFWWNKYLKNPDFRKEQELEAYRFQYQNLKENHNHKSRRYILKNLAEDFSSPAYGNIVTFEEAKKLITD